MEATAASMLTADTEDEDEEDDDEKKLEEDEAEEAPKPKPIVVLLPDALTVSGLRISASRASMVSVRSPMH